MMIIAKMIATVFGVGYIEKGAGTAAAGLYCAAWWLFSPGNTAVMQVSLLLVVLVIGIWSANKLEKIWEHDSNKIVIDEVAGMMIALLFVPANIKYLLAGFLLFRFFDIVKPLGIKKAEQLPGGFGIMADDVLAGIYAQLVLKGIIMVKLF